MSSGNDAPVHNDLARDVSADLPTSSMAALGVQYARTPENQAQSRARYFNSANAFNVKLPEVPAGIFSAPVEQARCLPVTAWYACDQSAQLGSPWPATTPFMLARYARVEPGDTLRAAFLASGTICYVMQGCISVTLAPATQTTGRHDARHADAGHAHGAHTDAIPRGRPDGVMGTDDVLHGCAGDVMLLPGRVSFTATSDVPALLWVVTDEPLLAHHGLQAAPEHANHAPVHFKAEDIAEQIEMIHRTTPDAGTSGMAVVFASAAQEARRNLMPALTLSLNTLAPHAMQSPHRHNSAALTLVLAGDTAYSSVDGRRCDWQSGATLVTPAGAPHSHHNEGDTLATFLIVQDGGLYYEGRTMNFQFLPGDACRT